uniref:Bestrophin homolog n=1 Tax=Panagrellus redivivus TaxID=6233 RepID=A0A7E4W400_PANRE
MLRRPLTTVTLEATELDPILIDCDVNKAAHDDYKNPFFMELMVWVDNLIKLNVVPKWLPSKTEIADLNDTEMHNLWLRVGCIVEDFTDEQEARLLQDTANPTPEDAVNAAAPSASSSSRPGTAGTNRGFSADSASLLGSDVPERQSPPSPTDAVRRRVLEQIESDMQEDSYMDGPASPDEQMQSDDSDSTEGPLYESD